VAVIAEITAGQMLGVFALRTTAVMALKAFQRCAFELTVYVTTGTVNKLVSAYQRETGCKVVEATVRFSCLN